jgi:hypothetical protein
LAERVPDDVDRVPLAPDDAPARPDPERDEAELDRLRVFVDEATAPPRSGVAGTA